MGYKTIDLTGQVFKDLKVIKHTGSDKFSRAMFECECSCGKIVEVAGVDLRAGKKTSCGCKNNQKTRTTTKYIIKPKNRVFDSDVKTIKCHQCGLILEQRYDDFGNPLKIQYCETKQCTWLGWDTMRKVFANRLGVVVNE